LLALSMCLTDPIRAFIHLKLPLAAATKQETYLSRISRGTRMLNSAGKCWWITCPAFNGQNAQSFSCSFLLNNGVRVLPTYSIGAAVRGFQWRYPCSVVEKSKPVDSAGSNLYPPDGSTSPLELTETLLFKSLIPTNLILRSRALGRRKQAPFDHLY